VKDSGRPSCARVVCDPGAMIWISYNQYHIGRNALLESQEHMVRVRESVGVSYQDVLILERWHICNCLTARLGPPVAEVLAKDASRDVTGR